MTKHKENYERIADADVNIGDELEAIPPLGENFTYDPAGLPDSDGKVYGDKVLTAINELAHGQRFAELGIQEKALQSLIASGILTATDSELTWRDGHIAHIARQYAADPKLTLRDYNDELIVLVGTHNAEFDALVAAARGE